MYHKLRIELLGINARRCRCFYNLGLAASMSTPDHSMPLSTFKAFLTSTSLPDPQVPMYR